MAVWWLARRCICSPIIRHITVLSMLTFPKQKQTFYITHLLLSLITHNTEHAFTATILVYQCRELLQYVLLFPFVVIPTLAQPWQNLNSLVRILTAHLLIFLGLCFLKFKQFLSLPIAVVVSMQWTKVKIITQPKHIIFFTHTFVSNQGLTAQLLNYFHTRTISAAV